MASQVLHARAAARSAFLDIALVQPAQMPLTIVLDRAGVNR
jgi:hypothetical protein